MVGGFHHLVGARLAASDSACGCLRYGLLFLLDPCEHRLVIRGDICHHHDAHL